MEDNIKTFTERGPLADSEREMLLSIAERMKDSVPCTACRYCVEHCPMELNIPGLLAVYNDIRFAPVMNVAMRIEGLPENKQPSVCIGCGACAKMCPQKIDIPGAMRDFAEKLNGIPKWADICRQREEAAKKIREGR